MELFMIILSYLAVTDLLILSRVSLGIEGLIDESACLWRHINLDDVEWISIELFEYILQHASFVHSLSFGGDIRHLCNQVTDYRVITDSLAKFTKLEKLSLENNRFLHSATFLSTMPELVTLNLRNCYNIQSVTLISSISSCAKLKYLMLFGCDQLEFDAVKELIKYVPNLLDLQLAYTTVLTPSQAEHILKCLGKLKKLVITPYLTNNRDTWKQLCRFYPSLHFEHLLLDTDVI